MHARFWNIACTIDRTSPTYVGYSPCCGTQHKLPIVEPSGSLLCLKYFLKSAQWAAYHYHCWSSWQWWRWWWVLIRRRCPKLAYDGPTHCVLHNDGLPIGRAGEGWFGLMVMVMTRQTVALTILGMVTDYDWQKARIFLCSLRQNSKVWWKGTILWCLSRVYAKLRTQLSVRDVLLRKYCSSFGFCPNYLPSSYRHTLWR